MSRAFLGRCFVALLVLGPLGAVMGQQKKDEPPPAPKPGPEHALLRGLEGTWDALIISTDNKKSKGVMTYAMECGGLWLSSDFKGEFDGQTFQGKGFDGYDPGTKKFVGVWVDSMITVPMQLEGVHDAASKTMTHTGQAPGPGGQPIKMKIITKMPDNDHQVSDFFMIGPDGSQTKMMTIEYTRRK